MTEFDELGNLIGPFSTIIIVVLCLSTVIYMWKIFVKTGRKGFISLVPFYNIWVFFEIANLKGWYALVPIANLFMMFVAFYKVAILFGKDVKFAILSVIFSIICMNIIAFDKSSYSGYIEEPKMNYNHSEPVYKSDSDIIESVSEMPIDGTTDYKTVTSTKLNIDGKDDVRDPLIDYGIKMKNTELPDPEPVIEKKNKFIFEDKKEEKIEVLDL